MQIIFDLAKYQEEADRICNQEGVPHVIVSFSNKLKTTAGRYWAKDYSVHISTDTYFQFGFDRSLGTLRHEVAHHITWIKNGYCRHDYLFKSICARLGGTMNPKQAGYQFASSATTDFIQRTRLPRKYHYTCPCGVNFYKARQYRGRSLFRTCRICNTKVADMILTIE